ncbi:MAG: hypothetical protein AAF962_15185 [Actinomycetota bacterium]
MAVPVDLDAPGGAYDPPPIFIHDFAPVPLDWLSAVGGFVALLNPASLTELVVDAWNAEAEAAAGHGLPLAACRPDQIVAAVGRVRHRADAAIIPIAWSGVGMWVSPLEADIEVARFGADRLHVHILGRSQLPPTAPPQTAAASLHQRVTVAVVRHVLAAMVAKVTAEVPRR